MIVILLAFLVAASLGALLLAAAVLGHYIGRHGVPAHLVPYARRLDATTNSVKEAA